MRRLVQKILDRLPFLFIWRQDHQEIIDDNNSTKEQLSQVIQRANCCLEVLNEWRENKIGNLRAITELESGLLIGKRIPKKKMRG